VDGFLLAWLEALGLYALVVSMGTFLFLVGAQIVGYVSYSLPLPGSGGEVFSWSEVRLYVVWLPVLAYSSLSMEALLFPLREHLAGYILRVGSLASSAACSLGLLRL
jgi:hypothetical protein